MGVFDDKKFEELDWISQATEPIDSQLNEVLGLIPEVINVDFDLYIKIASMGYGLDLSTRGAVDYCVRNYCKHINVTYDNVSHLRNLFKFEADGEMTINFEDRTLSGNLRIIKLANTMDEKVLAGMLGRDGVMRVSSMNITQDGLSRANDIMELLGKCDAGLRTRSERKKRQMIVSRLTELFKNNEWIIKDTELANKVGMWINQYVVDGNLAAYSNFCRLKVMTHKGQPIYSMQETI